MTTVANSLPAPSTLVGLLWPVGSDSRVAALRAMVLLAVGSATSDGLCQGPGTASVRADDHADAGGAVDRRDLWLAPRRRDGGVYLLQGALGMPVFANTPPMIAGPAYFAGPTGGFLIGFLAAAFVMGIMAERGWDRTLVRVAVMMTLGHAIILLAGFGWLCVLLPVAKAWSVGIAPFIAATIVKTALAASLIQAAWSVTRRGNNAV